MNQHSTYNFILRGISGPEEGISGIIFPSVIKYEDHSNHAGSEAGRGTFPKSVIRSMIVSSCRGLSLKKKKQFKLWPWLLAGIFVIFIAGEIAFQFRGGAKGQTTLPGYYQLKTVNKPLVRQETPEVSTVAVIQSTNDRAEDITEQEIEDMVRQAVLIAGGMNSVVKNGDTVVIKPNLVLMRENNRKDSPFLLPEANGISADWRVTKAVVKLVREVNPSGKVYIMESTADESTEKVMKHLKYTPEFIPGVTGFIAIEKDAGAWRDMKSPDLVKVPFPEGKLNKIYYFDRKFYEADVLISIPTLKTHFNAVMTGALKNTGIGATPPSVYGMSKNNILKMNMVNHLSDDLHKWIRDYNRCRPISFVVMDALQGLQNGPIHGYGPLSNDQMNMRLVVAGKDPVAVDTVEALLAGWDPESINYLNYLSKDGAGNADIARINIVGKRVDEVRKYLDGTIPLAGGRKIFDREPPEFSVKGVSIVDGGLSISLDTEKKIRKIEVFIDGNLIGYPVTNDFNRIFYTNFTVDGDTHTVSICAYDRFLNRSEQTVDLK